VHELMPASGSKRKLEEDGGGGSVKTIASEKSILSRIASENEILSRIEMTQQQHGDTLAEILACLHLPTCQVNLKKPKVTHEDQEEEKVAIKANALHTIAEAGHGCVCMRACVCARVFFGLVFCVW